MIGRLQEETLRLESDRCGRKCPMSDVSQILVRVQHGEHQASEELLPLVYEELRRLAARKMGGERPDHTLNATALVHEAWLRLVGSGDGHHRQQWEGRRHFFAAAAEAMRRILVESARRKRRLRHGGARRRLALDGDVLPAAEPPLDDLLSVHEALDALAAAEPQTAELVKLHYFAGLTLDEAAQALGISPRTACRNWAFARAWLYRRLTDGTPQSPP